jgi:hypothetical protein
MGPLAKRLQRERVEAEAWIYGRDEMHVGIMRQGMCMKCFGWVDDPRHTRLVYSLTLLPVSDQA